MKFRARIDIKFDAEDVDDALRVLAEGFKSRAEGKDDIWFEGEIKIKPYNDDENVSGSV